MADDITKSLSMLPNARHERLLAAKRADTHVNESRILDKIKAEGWQVELTASGWSARNPL